MLQYRPRPPIEKFSLCHSATTLDPNCCHIIRAVHGSSGQLKWSRNVHDTKNAHNLCNNCHMTRHTHILRRHCWYRYDCILTSPASGHMSTSGVRDVPRSTPSTPSWNTIHTISTMMETRFIGGARINKESRPEINSAAGEASIQLLQLIPCCRGGHFSDANFA